MRAAIFERQGLEYLNVKEDVEQPTITDHDVLIITEMQVDGYGSSDKR